MTKEQVLGMLRHILTLGGGYVIAKGIADENTLNQVVGAVVTLVGFVWSWIDKTKKPA